jgi:hypothetical protein
MDLTMELRLASGTLSSGPIAGRVTMKICPLAFPQVRIFQPIFSGKWRDLFSGFLERRNDITFC